jgi:hypothetical protein
MKHANIVLVIISILLFFGIMMYVNFLTRENYVKLVENFEDLPFKQQSEAYKPRDTYYSYSANDAFTDFGNAASGYTTTNSMPITETQDCKNFCNPAQRCSITGQQCAADTDCPGCYPKVKGKTTYKPMVPAANDAGKLTTGLALNYSPLTFGFGSRNETIVPPKKNQTDKYPFGLDGKAVPKADFGVNTWQQQFLQGNQMYKQRYSLPSDLQYKPMETTTGQFVTDDPLPSNY